jgi:hypothetical protein
MDPLSELRGGQLRKRHGGDGIRLDTPLDQVDDPLAEHLSFTTAGPGDNQQRREIDWLLDDGPLRRRTDEHAPHSAM